MRLGAFRICAIYVVISIIWITLSDKALFLFTHKFNASALQIISGGKGVFFVFVTGILLYQLIKRDDQKLLSNEKQYRTMYEGNQLPMWVYNSDTLKFVSVNDAAISTYGYSADEFLRMTILDIRPSEDIPKVIEASKSVTKSIKQSGLWIHKKADGTLMYVNISSQQITFNNQQQVMVTAQDITEKVLLRQKLEKLNNDLSEQKRKLSETQDIAKVAGWEYYPEQKELVWSDGLFKILDIQPDKDEDLYKLSKELLKPEDRAWITDEIKKLIDTGKPFAITHCITLFKGQTIYLRQIARLEYVDGNPYRVVGSVQDITEHKLMEFERNKYLVSLDDTLNNISEGFYTLNKELKFTKVNKKFELETGLRGTDIIGKRLTNVFPGMEGRATHEHYLKVLREKQSVSFEAYWRHFKKWHHVSAYPTEDGIAVYYHDITERKEKDQQLKQAVERYEKVTRATQDVIYDYDLVNDKLLYNTSFIKLLNLNKEQAGESIKGWQSFIHPDDLVRIVKSQQEIIKKQEANWGCEYRLHCGNGHYKYVYDQGYFTYNEHGEPLRLIGAIKDIDALKRSNEENRRLAGIMTRINNMVLIMDTEHRITWVNKAFEDYTGHTFNEVRGRKPHEFLGGDKIPVDVLSSIMKRQERLEAFAIDMKHYLKSGTEQWVNVEFTPLFDDNGMYTGYIAVHKNITERKEKEEKIKQQNKALQEISWLSSHEIRRPVASILGLAYLAKDSNKQDKEEIIEMINDCAEELDIIVHAINERITNELYNGIGGIPVEQLN